MKRKIAISAIGITGVLGAAAAGYLLNDKARKKQNKPMEQTFEFAGVPDQSGKVDLAQLENAKMVSEGSQFGVQYYNEMKENNRLDQQQNL